MNFFGHATVAARLDARPTVGLGAMLPDFVAMLGEPMPQVSSSELSAGVRLHHATDAAFHESPLFCELNRGAVGWLLARGMSRGSARAIGHVGVEILLDEVLSRDSSAREAYGAALRAGSREQLATAIVWKRTLAPGRFAVLLATLVERAPNGSAPSTLMVAQRLHRIVERRPLLAFGEEQVATVSEWIDHTRPRMADIAQELLESVLKELGP